MTGTVKGADADKDVLTYSAPASTTKGTVTVNAATGAFIYTPSPTARDAAAGTAAAAKTDSFTVTITDGHTGGVKTQVVNVAIAPKAAVGVVGTVDLAGDNYDAVMNGNGTRAVITTVTGDDTKGYSTSVTVVNVATGAKIGTAVKLAGQSNGVVFSDDGTKALVSTYVGDTDSGTVRVAVINASTGKQVGSALSLQGSAYLPDALQFNADGSRAILTLDGYSDVSGDAVRRLTLVNTLTGARVGTTREYANAQSDDDFNFVDPVTIDSNVDGSRLIVTTTGIDPDSNVETAQVTIINTATGTDVGTTTVTGVLYNPVSYNADSSRAIIAYVTNLNGTTSTTHVLVLNVSTGAQVGFTVDHVGAGAAHLSDDGSQFVVNATVYNEDGDGTSFVSVFNTATGAQVGSPIILSGATLLPAQFNAAGTRAVVTVYSVDDTGPNGVRVVVVNTATGAQVGATVDVAGIPFGYDGTDPRTLQPLQLNTDGTRALVTTTAGGSTNVALINTLTGAKLGSTLTVLGDVTFEAQDGTSFLPPLYNDDDSRAFITTVSGDETSGYVTRVALLNTANGAQVGSTIALTGAPGVYADDANVVASGNRAVYLTYTGDDTTGYITRLAIINTDNGAQLAATREFTGSWSSFVQFNAAGNRITVLADTASTDTDPATTELSVYDAATGAQVGSTLTFTGDDWTGATVDDDPSRAIVYTASATSSTVTAVDLLTANRIGSTVTLTGEAWSTYRSDDSSRVVVASVTGTGTKITTKVSTLQIGDPTGAPINGAFTAGSPNVSTGVVTGTVTATDSQGDPLSYSGTSTTTSGTVTVATDGTFTYTPTAAARHAALTANGAQTDTFNVIASDPLGNSLAVAVTVAIQPGPNAAPTNATAIPGLPNTTTGVVTGTLSATDTDGDALTYTGPSTTTKGSLSITGTTFTYTPSPAARQAAAGGAADDVQDTFTITVSDSHGGTAPISVTVAIQPAATGAPTTVTTVNTVTVDGAVQNAYFSKDGSRAVVATKTSGGIAFTVLNGVSGGKIGNAVTVTGAVVTAVEFSADGSRAVVSTNDDDFDQTIHVAIINTASGQQVGTTYTASNGYTSSNSVGGFAARLNSDGTRASIASTAGFSDATGRVVLLNTANGATVYDSGDVDGIAQISFSGNGGRAIVTFQDPNAPSGGTTQVRFVNAVAGTQVGSTLTRTGASSVALNADGTKAIFADFTQTVGGDQTEPVPVFTTKVALFNFGGSQIGNTVTLPYAALLPAQFTADGSRAVLTVLG
ncbi:MAG: beta strand repeat-containing protein, partial [Mycobacterium sp.]